MNVLIADDDPTSRIVLAATLKKLGHQVTVAKDGAEAWTVFENGEVPTVSRRPSRNLKLPPAQTPRLPPERLAQETF